MGEAGQDAFLCRQVPLRFQPPDFLNLVFSAQQQRVIVIRSEHPVTGHAVGGVQYMHVPSDPSGTLPLVDVQSRGAGKNDIRLQHIHPGKGAVAFSRKFRFDMFIFFMQQRIIRGRGQVQDRFTALFHFITERLENRPVTLAVCKEHEGRPYMIQVPRLFPRNHYFQLHPAVTQGINRRAEHSDENGEQHTPCAGVNVEKHVRGPPSCSHQTRFCSSAPDGRDP